MDEKTGQASGTKPAGRMKSSFQEDSKLSVDDASAFSSAAGTLGVRSQRQESGHEESHNASHSDYDATSESRNTDGEAVSLLVSQLQDSESRRPWETHAKSPSVKSQHSSDAPADDDDDDDDEDVAARRAYYRKNAARARKRYKENVANLRNSVDTMREEIGNLKRSNKELEERIEFLVAEKSDLEEYGRMMNLTTDQSPSMPGTIPQVVNVSRPGQYSTSQKSEATSALQQLMSSSQGGQDVSGLSTHRSMSSARSPQNDSIDMAFSQFLSSQQRILPAVAPSTQSHVHAAPISHPSSSSVPSGDAASLITQLLLSNQNTVPSAAPPVPPPASNLSPMDAQNLIGLLTALQSSFGSDTSAVLQLLLSPTVAGNLRAVVALLQLLLQAKNGN